MPWSQDWTGWARRAWVPRDLAGCVLWLRSDTGITTATGVSQWADQSGQGNTLAQATAGLQPAYNTTDAAFSGRPSVQFDGVDDVLTKANTTLVAAGGQYSVFYVIRWTALSGNFQMAIAQTAAGTGGVEFGTDTADNKRIINHASVSVGVDGLPSIGATEVVTNLWTSGVAASMRVNGAAVSLTTSPTTMSTATTPPLNLGGRASASLPAACKLAEVVWYSRQLSASEVTRVERYLGGLYGVAIA